MADNLFDYADKLAQQARQQQANLFNSAFSQSSATAIEQAQLNLQQFNGFNIEGWIMGNQPGMSHLGTVREFRRKFKEYTKAEFREMGSKPVIKEILSGMTKLNKEQIQERIAEHLAVV